MRRACPLDSSIAGLAARRPRAAAAGDCGAGRRSALCDAAPLAGGATGAEPCAKGRKASRQSRVLVILPWGERRGGAEEMAHAIFTAGAALPWRLEAVFLGAGSWAEELAAGGLPVRVIPAGRLRQLVGYVRCVRALAGVMREVGPDLVVAWSAKCQLYAAPAAALAGISRRLIWWQHMVPDPGLVDRLATILPAAAVGCSSYCGAAAQSTIRPVRRTFVVHPGVPDPGVPRGGALGGIAAGAAVPIGGEHRRMEALENAPVRIAPAALRMRGELGLPADVPVIGMVGRLQPWKGQDRLIEAHALLRQSSVRLHTLIVGGDAYGRSPAYAASLQPLVERLGLAGEVTFTGEVPSARPYMEAMDVLVNASEPEPFGIVLIEAMALGVPVLAVDRGGPREIVEHMESGYLVDSGAPSSLARALLCLLGSAGLREQLAVGGRRRFIERFSEQRMLTSLDERLSALLAAPA